MSNGSPRTPADPAPAALPAALPAEASFNEELYLRLNPDVLIAVAGGSFRSGREHFERFGRAEGRPVALPVNLVPDRVMVTADAARIAEKPRAPGANVDHIKISPSGGVYVVGWVNDTQDQLVSVDLYFSGWSISFSAANLARVRRPDAENAVGLRTPHHCGYWGFLYAARPLPANVCNAVVRLKSGVEMPSVVMVEGTEDEELRRAALHGLSQAVYTGNHYFASVQSIDAAIGAQLAEFNKMLTRRAVNAPYVEYFGRANASYKASIIVCLFGRTEYMYVQQAMFARQAGIGDYEFIYVCNSPDTAEALLREAKLSGLMYGLDVTIILLNANAGFAAANNLAAKHARSGRLVFVNPDVFPRDVDWAAKHSAIVAGQPAEQTALFGAPLFYDDSSLMHGGMYFELDTAPSFTQGQHQETTILRVEHYGKGVPPDTAEYLRPRPVPAVTGAFISTAREWFETLGGFTEDYIFGHYEDADLSLKSLAAGRPAWLHDATLWHLEGKGSHRQPQHEGGSIVNRWLFTKRWKGLVEAEVLGPAPVHPAFGVSK
jgi:GT2 family glycosyltransferase